MAASESLIKQIVKRDGNVVAYDRDRIATVIFKAAAAVGGSDRQTAEQLALKAQRDLDRIKIEAQQKITQAQAEA